MCYNVQTVKAMGNTANAGLAILNETDFPVTCTCSMGATQRYENHVQPGQILYRWPGAVWMTLAASQTTESTMYTDDRCRNQFSLVSVAFGGGGSSAVGNILANIFANMVDTGVSRSVEATRAINALTTLAAFFTKIMGLFSYPIASLKSEKALTSDEIESESLRSYEQALRSSNLETSQIGCYGGRDGTWLILSGGPQKYITSDGKVRWSPRRFHFQTSEQDRSMDARGIHTLFVSMLLRPARQSDA